MTKQKKNIDFKDFVENFLQFEKEHGLFELKHKDIYYWHLIRYSLFSRIAHEKDLNPAVADPHASIADRMNFLRDVPGQLKHYFDGRRYDIFLSYIYLRKEIAGKLVNPFTWFMRDYDCFSIKEHTLFHPDLDKEARRGSNTAICRVLWIPKYIYAKVIQKIGVKFDPEFVRVLGTINTRFECKLNFTEFVNRAFFEVQRFRVYKRYYSRILQLGRYRVAMMGYYGSQDHLALIAAANEQDIPVVELMHGALDEGDPLYNFGDTSKIGKYYPDYIYTFGDYWNGRCRLPDYVKSISVGVPQMDYSREVFKGSVKDDKAVMFVSSRNIGPAMSHLALRFAQYVASVGGYRVIYKLHPFEVVDWKERYSWLAKAEGIQIVDAPINVHSLLATTQHVVGVSSTVLYEAIAFACNVYVWDGVITADQGLAERLVEAGIAPLFENEKHLLQLIENSSDKNNMTELANSMYKPNSVDNIQEALRITIHN